VRVICEKYRLRGEVNIPSRFSGEAHLTVLETGIFRKYPSPTGYIHLHYCFCMLYVKAKPWFILFLSLFQNLYTSLTRFFLFSWIDFKSQLKIKWSRWSEVLKISRQWCKSWKKLRIGKKKLPLSSTNQKTAFWYKVELINKLHRLNINSSIPLWYPYFEIIYYLLIGIEKVTVLNSFYFHTHKNHVTMKQQYRDGGYFLKMKTMFLHKKYEFSAWSLCLLSFPS
jgi:hypothetical protein